VEAALWHRSTSTRTQPRRRNAVLAGLTLLQLVLTVVAVVVGSIAQSTVGMGIGIVMVPVLAVIAPDLLPAMPLILASVLSVAMIVRERTSMDLAGLPPLIVGRILGTGAAVVLLILLTGPALEILFGVVILSVVLISAMRPAVEPTASAKFAGGAASGLFATTAAIGGPPIAVLYQGRPGPEVRSTMGVIFAFGSALSLVALIPAGRLRWEHVVLGVLLLIPAAVGFAISTPLARFLEGRWFRPSLLVFAAAGGLMAVIRGLTA
jgi:uncharacterized protein